jgi:hypothetical protein
VKCYVCRQEIAANGKRRIDKGFGVAHPTCFKAHADIKTKPLNVPSFPVQASEVSEEERMKIIEDNILGEVDV